MMMMMMKHLGLRLAASGGRRLATVRLMSSDEAEREKANREQQAKKEEREKLKTAEDPFEIAKKKAKSLKSKKRQNLAIRLMYGRICSISSDIKVMGVVGLMDDSAKCIEDAASRCMNFGSSIEEVLKENKKQHELEDEQNEEKQNQFEENKKHLDQKLRLVYLLGEKILEYSSEMEKDRKLQVENTFKVITIADLLIKGKINISKVIPKRDGGFRFGTFNGFEDAHRFSMYLKTKDEDEDVEQDEFFSSFMGMFIGHEAWILEVKRRFVCPPFSVE